MYPLKQKLFTYLKPFQEITVEVCSRVIQSCMLIDAEHLKDQTY